MFDLVIADASGPRAAGRPAGARRLHGPAHGADARLQDRAAPWSASTRSSTAPSWPPSSSRCSSPSWRPTATSSTSTPATCCRSSCTTNGEIEYLREGGMVLGPSPNATYLRGFAQLRPGDMLVLYTDGITECHHHRTRRGVRPRPPAAARGAPREPTGERDRADGLPGGEPVRRAPRRRRTTRRWSSSSARRPATKSAERRRAGASAGAAAARALYSRA